MALNPFREALGRAGLRAFEHESSFKPTADSALARFHAIRDDVERQVRRGDLTMKAARDKAGAAAAHVRDVLSKQAQGFSPVPRVFMDRLIEASNTRARAREHLSLEGLQRETNKLLRMSLVEQQLQTRAKEFEGRTHTRSLPGGQPAPSLDSLLAFHETAVQSGDEAAMEWGRRQLETIRPRVVDPAEQRRIDLACDRPDAVNPRLVATYMEALESADAPALEEFVANALDGRDSNACIASFLMARDSKGGTSVRWVRNVLTGLDAFPDAALKTLRSLEAEAREADSEAAKSQAEYAIAVAESQVSLAGIDVPSEEELAQQAKIRARPVAALGEEIGLGLKRRGRLADEPLGDGGVAGGPPGEPPGF
jgi:hypothetical protein